MALATKPILQEQQRTKRRIWKTPGSKFNWICLAISLIMYACIYAWYLNALKTQPYAGPYSDPLRLFGIVSFCLVLLVAAYTLRRHFFRKLPGKVQNWLWLHTWFGVISILIAFLHENYANILHDYSFTWPSFTEAAYGMSALYALILLIISGIIGRLLDRWQAHVIAAEANSNGVGIVQAVRERLLELDLTVERLSAGKSPAFKTFCFISVPSSGSGKDMTSSARGGKVDTSNPHKSRANALRNKTSLTRMVPALAANELEDFERVYEVLTQRVKLVGSLKRQMRARFIIRVWRYVHIPLACLALLIIGYHGISELWMMLIHGL